MFVVKNINSISELKTTALRFSFMSINTERHVFFLLIRIENVIFNFYRVSSVGLEIEKYSSFHNLSLIQQSASEKKVRFIKQKNIHNCLEKQDGLTNVDCNNN